jgi:hypothetical protein
MGVFGQKKPETGRIGLKKQAHHFMRMGLKASNLAMGAGAVALLAGPEAIPVASALEAGGAAGKAIFSLGSQIV